MKKILSLILALLLGLSCGALADDKTCGTLSYLNMTEEEDSIDIAAQVPLVKILYLHGVLKKEGDLLGDNPVLRHYDSLNALLMGLMTGEVDSIRLPYYTGKYLCATNDGLKLAMEYDPDKAVGVSRLALSILSDGYSFLMKEENAALRDEFDAQITAMKEDGTLQKLIDEHIVKASEGGEPVAVAFEKFEGDPIKVAVTGSLPPMDYVAADGSFAGFNTAVLAEIGKRLQKNIELVQVDSVGRALALAEGTVDVVFWTRGLSESSAVIFSSDDKAMAEIAKERESMTEEEIALFDEGAMPDPEARAKIEARDMPEGTIITQPYFSDFPVRVILK